MHSHVHIVLYILLFLDGSCVPSLSKALPSENGLRRECNDMCPSSAHGSSSADECAFRCLTFAGSAGYCCRMDSVIAMCLLVSALT